MDYRFKSWSGLNKQLAAFLCDSLRERITYFFTFYHKAHSSYGRAAIRLDGRELVCFSWIEMFRQEYDETKLYEQTGHYVPEPPELKEKWDQHCTYCNYDFLNAALTFLNQPVTDSLMSEDYIQRIFAVLDRRVGKRTLLKIRASGEYREYPAWVRQFYELRFRAERIGTEPPAAEDNTEERQDDMIVPHSRITQIELLVQRLKELQKTVATAESCTGGLLGKSITDISGSSAVYPGGVISYCNRIKHEILGVEQELLDTLGPVSEPVARQMAEGVRRVIGADFGVGVTGIAGPNSDETGRPVGLVYISAADGSTTLVREYRFDGDRGAIRAQAAEAAADLVLELIKE